MEKIIRAALQDPTDRDEVFHVPAPGRHGDVIAKMAQLFGNDDPRMKTYTQGFIAEKHVEGVGMVYRFVDRHEACKIAREAGQIKTKTGGEDELYSEDVW